MADIESIILLLLERMNSLINQEATFLGHVHGQLQSMIDEFRSLQFSLKDADARQDVDEAKYWLQNVRGVAYEVEAAIDTFALKTAAPPPRQGGQFMDNIKRSYLEFSKLYALSKLSSRLNEISIKIRSIPSRSWHIGGQGGAGNSASSGNYGQLNHRECSLPSFCVPEPDFVGFEKELQTLTEQLTGGEQKLCVVSVLGMPGLGKTTLAKKAYNSNAVKSHFNIRAWVYASGQYSVRELLLQTIAECGSYRLNGQLSLSDEAQVDVPELLGILNQKLNNNSYLIILDGIWELDVWHVLEKAFPDTGNGSRVLLITSSLDVAGLADSEGGIQQLRCFRRQESWQLFCEQSFSKQYDRFPSDFARSGRRFLRKCRGVPLAIVILRGILSRKDPQEWENVNENIKLQWDEEDQLSDILSQSWKDLPYYLRPCLIYMSNFPENYKFRAKKLIHLWEAEAMLRPRGDKTEEQVGEEFLMELVQRQMVQIETKSSTSSIKTCGIHSLVHKLGASKDVAFSSLAFTPSSISNSPNVHRLVLHDCSINSLRSIFDNYTFLRTLVWLNWNLSRGESQPFPSSISVLKLLRVLDLEGATISELPNEIGQLIHLRYLGLRRTMLRLLPPSTRNLVNLQTLDVKFTLIDQIPDAIQGMPRLRHLNVSRDIRVGNSGLIESLKELQTVSMMHADAWMEKGLSKLVSLRKLGIKGDLRFCSNSLSSLSKLESLRVVLDFQNTTLDWKLLPRSLVKLHLDRRLQELPPALPGNLVKLCLRWSLLEEHQFATFQSLKNLKMLLLGRGSFVGKKMIFTSREPSQIEVLRIDQLNDLEELSIENGALPCLVSLVIRSCRRLKELPEGLRYVVSTLKLLETEFMTDEFKSAVKRHPFIQHIPSVNIN